MSRAPAALCLMLLLSTSAPAEPGGVPDDPEKWVETDPPEYGSDRWRVASVDVGHEWAVVLRGGRPRVRPCGPEGEAVGSLPSRVEPGSSREGLAGTRLSVKVSDGWLVAFNAGEFGAGLWWFSPDGRTRYKVAELWITEFVPTEAGLLALEGLAHGNVCKGRIVRLTRTPGGRWRFEDVLDLKHAPVASTRDSAGSLIVATTGRLLRVAPADKKVEVLVDHAFWSGLYPNSMAVTLSGTVYLGMRHGVAKAEKMGGSYRLRWLLPDKSFDTADSEPGFK